MRDEDPAWKRHPLSWTSGVVLLVLLGWRFYRDHHGREGARAELVEQCDDSSYCLQAIERHFDDCHARSQRRSYGRRHDKWKLDKTALRACIDSADGTEFFSDG